MVNKKTRKKIESQIANEIQVARWYKSTRVSTWQKNETLRFESERVNRLSTSQNAKDSNQSRISVSLHKMNGYLQTILSKVDNNLVFKFLHHNPADFKRVKRINAIKEVDSERDNWDFKDLLGKDQGIFYGRAIYQYYASLDEDGNYAPHLENIDVYDFLIDPNAGGLDIENARYLGHANVEYTRTELQDGIKSGKFLKEETERLLEGNGTSSPINKEEIDKANRYFNYRNFTENINKTQTDVFRFFKWNTTYQGIRYYTVYDEESGVMIRCEEQKKMIPSGKWNYWTWACFPSLTEFWSQSYADIAREIMMAQGASINQLLDNADKRNNPQRIIDTTSLVDENELMFKKKGFIRATGDVSNIYQELETPSLETPLDVYETLENILQLNSGVTGAAQGIADEEKVGIYEGNQIATEDRFKLLNKSYSNGYKKFGQLYLEMLKEFCPAKFAVKLIGPKGIEISEIGPDDLDTDGDVLVAVLASDAENNVDTDKKKIKIEFLTKYAQAQFINPKAAFEIEGEMIGFDQDELKRLTDVKNEQDMEIISECWRDIQDIISGKKVKPNLMANVAYATTLFNYMRDNKENLKTGPFMALASYFEAIKPIVIRNQVITAESILASEGLLGANGGVPGVETGQEESVEITS